MTENWKKKKNKKRAGIYKVFTKRHRFPDYDGIVGFFLVSHQVIVAFEKVVIVVISSTAVFALSEISLCFGW